MMINEPLKNMFDSPFGVQLMYDMGNKTANRLKEDLKNGNIDVNDEMLHLFLPCLFCGGNLDFLIVMAESMYDDTRVCVITEFLETILKWTFDAHDIITSMEE